MKVLKIKRNIDGIIKYKLLFANQSSDTTKRFSLIRETKSYVYLKEIGLHEPNFIFRVHKKTLNVKGIKEGDNYDGHQWDVPTARFLQKCD